MMNHCDPPPGDSEAIPCIAARNCNQRRQPDRFLQGCFQINVNIVKGKEFLIR